MEYDDDLDGTLNIDEEELFRNSKPTGVLEKHLDSPISVERLKRILAAFQKCTSKYGRITNTELSYLFPRGNKISYGNILNACQATLSASEVTRSQPTALAILSARTYFSTLSAAGGIPTRVDQDSTTANAVFDHVIESHLRYCSDVLKPTELRLHRERLERVKAAPSSVTHYWANQAACWDRLVEEYRMWYATTRHDLRVRTYTQGRIQWGFSKYSLIARYDSKEFICTYEQVQMLQDICLMRFNTYYALDIGLHNGTDNLRAFVTDLLEWQESCLTLYGEDGYELVKAPEAIFKARLNTLSQGDILPVTSYLRTLRKLEKKEQAIEGRVTATSALDSLARRVTSLPDCAELFGLIKLSGHPAVDPRLSAASVRAEAMNYGFVHPIQVMRTLRAFKHTILAAYIDRHQTWPPLALKPAPGTVLRRLWQSRVTSLPMSAYPQSDLDHIEFGQFLDFDYSEDYLKFLDDKAICPGANKSANFWFGGDKADKRLLLAALREKHIDMRALVERFSRRGFTRDELIVELTQKERELKKAARSFCKLPLPVRCFFTLIEYNLGEQLMKDYVPQQTMTMSATDTKRRLYDISKPRSNRRSCFLETDFSRWNLVMRSQTVDPIAKVIEDCYGMPGTWSQAHWFFTNSTIVMTDKDCCPDGVTPGLHASLWPVSDLVWRGHLGGFEGIQQKLWTLVTIAMIFAAMRGLRVSFLLAGQGDNHIMAITFPPDIHLRDGLITLLSKLEFYCRLMNHTVKPEECIDSTTVITYSKELYVSGVHHMFTLKFASRTFRREDSDIPSMTAEIAGICSSSGMVANTLTESLLGHYWQTFQLCRLITSWISSPVYRFERPYLQTLFRHGPKRAAFALLLPGSLGGLPVQSFAKYYIRGEVDDLSWDVTSVKMIGQTMTVLTTDLRLLLAGEYSTRKPDLSALLLDPHSIPIDRPKDQRRLIKDAIAKNLPSITKNVWLKEILDKSVDSVGCALRQILSVSKPLYPDIISDLHKASLAGLSDSIKARFNMTRTISQVLGGQNFVREIHQSNVDLFRFVIGRYNVAAQRLNAVPITESAYSICHRLRQKWGLSVSNAMIGTYCPLDQSLRSGVTDDIGIKCATRTAATNITTSIGDYPPNFGTQTRQKVSTHGYKVVMSQDTLKDLKTLVLVASELNAGPRLRQLVNTIAVSRSNWTLDTLETIFPTAYGGTAAHRHARIQRKVFSTLGSNTVPTHLNFSSDKSGILAGGTNDYPVVFQEYYLVLTQLTQQFSHVVRSCIAMTICIGDTALDPIPDENVEIPADLPPLKWPRMSPSNKLAFADTLQFSHIPYKPTAAIVPLATQPVAQQSILFTTFINASRYRTETITRLASTVLHAIEPLDLKEFLQTSLTDTLKACSVAAACCACYHVAVGPDTVSRASLRDALYRICSAASPGLVRLIAHPLTPASRIKHELGLAFHPGMRLPVASVMRLTGFLVSQALDLLESGHLLAQNYQYICCDDTSEYITTVRFMTSCATYLVMAGLNDSPQLRRYVNRLKNAEIQGMISGGRPAAYAMITAEYVAELPRLFPRVRIHSFSRDVGWPQFRQAPIDSAQLTRLLRGFILLPQILPLPSCTAAERLPSRLGAVTIVRGVDHFSSPSFCPGDCETSNPTNYDRVLSYAFRTHGRFASVYTVWLLHLKRLIPLFRNRRVVLVGVGRGAAACALLDLGASEIIGIDLRDSFPLLLQREFDYVPQEIDNSNYATRFKWSHHVFNQYSGDILKGPPLSDDYPDACLLFDIEVHSAAVLRCIPTFRQPVIARVTACFGCVQQLVGCLRQPRCFRTALYNTTASWILSGIPTGIAFSDADGSRLQLQCDPYEPNVGFDIACRNNRIRDLVETSGIVFKTSTLVDLDSYIAQLTLVSLNSNDVSIRQHSGRIVDILNECRVAVRNNTPIQQLSLINDRQCLRHAVLYAANSIPAYRLQLSAQLT